MPRSRRRWLLITVVLLVLIGGAGGAYYVFKVARSRTSPFKQAFALREAGDDKAAESELRSILKANKDDARSRLLLIDILADDDRIEDAEELARHWLDEPETESLGLRTLSRLALRRGDIATALGLARSIADREPAFSQLIIRRVYDAIGSPASRERSARASETLAGLVTAPEARAEAWLYAAETLRDVERMLKAGPLKASLIQRSALDREKARAALRESVYWKERYPEGKALMASIDLLSSTEVEQRNAVKVLRAYLEDKPDAHASRMSLIRHLVGIADYGKAAEHIRLLHDAPALLYIRALSAMAAAGERALVLSLIEEGEASQQKMLALLRARVLITGDGAEREAGIKAFEEMALENKDDETLVRESFLQIKAAGDLERAKRLLDQTGSEDKQLRFGILLDQAVAAIEASDEAGDQAGGDAHLAALADALEGSNLLPALNRLRQVKGAGEAAPLRLMEKALAAGKVSANQVRLLRAMLRLSPTAEPEEREAAKQRALEDLEAIAADPEAKRTALLSAASLAQALTATELLGRLMGRALVVDDKAGDPISLFVRACATKEEMTRSKLAAGLEGVAAPGFGPWIDKLAAALVAGDAQTLRISSSAWEPSEDAPQPTEASLQIALATLAKDWPEAEAYARKILTTWPDRPGGKVRLAAMLLAGKKFEDVLALYEGEDLEPLQRLQRIDALTALKRPEEALAEARSLARDSKGSDQALMILAQLQKDTAPDAALAAVSQVSPQASEGLRLRAELLRGELLTRRGDLDSAGLAYSGLVEATGRKNLLVWRRLGHLRAQQQRDALFIRRISVPMASPPPGMRPEALALLAMLRGQARENIKDYERALEDYQRVIAVLPKHVEALNNAAWIMRTHIAWGRSELPRRLEEALALVTTAAEAAPRLAPVFHTRAKILETMERNDAALADFDHAIGLFTQVLEAADGQRDLTIIVARRARYLLDKAALLESMRRVEDAVAVYIEVRDEHRGTTPEGRKAGAALERLGR